MEVKKDSKRKIKKELPTINIVVFLILRILVILCMVLQSMNGNWNNVFLCILTLVFFTLPKFVREKFNIELPKTLEIIIYLFIFSSEILGEVQNFYGIFKHWDTMLHTLNGFLCAAIGFSLVDILNRDKDNSINMTPGFVALVAFSFSMTVGVCWEFIEWGSDTYLMSDMQKDRIVNVIHSKELGDKRINEKVDIENITKTVIYYDKNKTYIVDGYLDIGLIDTMKDLFVNFIGAIIFCILGYLYIKDRDDTKFVARFIPKIKEIQES